jgi:copper transport protein
MAAWVGGLALLIVALLPRGEPDELARAIPVFSRVAFWSVVALAATGAWAAWHGVGLLEGFTTEYGLLVLGKIVLFLALVGLGNVSRTVVQRRWVGPVAYAMTAEVAEVPPPPVERLRRSVIVEIAIAAVVLALTAVLVGQPRGREAVAVRDRQPVTATTALGNGQTATVTLSPGVHGNVDAQVTLSGTAPQSVTATATQQARHLGPIPLGLHRDGGQLYSANNVTLPAAGRWQIELTVTRSQFDAVTADVSLTLH